MTNIQKRKTEKYLDNLYLSAIQSGIKSKEDVYLGVRNLVGSLGLIWHRDKHGKHYIF